MAKFIGIPDFSPKREDHGFIRSVIQLFHGNTVNPISLDVLRPDGEPVMRITLLLTENGQAADVDFIKLDDSRELIISTMVNERVQSLKVPGRAVTLQTKSKLPEGR